MGRKPNKQATAATEPAADESEAALLGQLAAINDAQAGRGFDPEISMACAAITRALTGVRSEHRQHAKALRRELATVPHDEVVAYLRSLPEDKRRDVCREVLGSDDDEPLL